MANQTFTEPHRKILVSLPEIQVQELDRLAQESFRKRTGLIRMAVRDFLRQSTEKSPSVTTGGRSAR